MSSSASSKILSNASLNSINKMFTEKGFVLRLAGGTVRDMILNMDEIDPINLVTDATLAETVSILRNCPSVENFSQLTQDSKAIHIVAKLVDKTIISVVSLDCNQELAKRLAANKSVKKWKLDAYNRVVTINSLYMDFDGKIIDFYGGKEDLEKGVIRFIEKPRNVLKNLPLCIFLYLHVYFEYGKQEHLPEYIEAIKENLPGLELIAGDGLRTVVERSLCHKNVDKLIPFMMVDLQIGKYLGFNSFRKSDLREFKAVHKNLSLIGPSNLPILLASLIRDELELDFISHRLDLPREWRFVILYILKHRSEDGNQSLGDLQKLIELVPVSHQNLYKIALLEFLKYKGRKDDLIGFFISEWPRKFYGIFDPEDHLVFSMLNLHFLDPKVRR